MAETTLLERIAAANPPETSTFDASALQEKNEQAALDAQTPKIEAPVTQPVETNTENNTDPTENALNNEDLQESTDDLKKRLARESHAKRQEKKQRELLQREIEVLRGQRTETTDEAHQRQVRIEAERLVSQQTMANDQRRILESGQDTFKDFGKVLGDWREAFPEEGGVPQQIIDAASELAHGDEHKVLYHLGKNLDEAERIYDLMKTSSMKGSVAFSEFVKKVTAPPAVSKAAKPITPITGAAKTPEPQLAQITDAGEWIKKRREEQEAKRKSGRRFS